MFWRLRKIIPPLRNSESKASGNKRSSKRSWWSDLRRTDFPKKWLMENQVKLSCFSPVSVHLEILLQLFWRLLDKISLDLTAQRHVKHQLKGTFVQLHKRALTWQKCLNYQSDIKRHGVDHPKNLMLNSKMFMHMLFVNYIMVFFFFPLAIEPPVAPCLNKSTFIRLDVFSSLPSLWNGMQHAVFARDVWYKSWSAWFCVRSPLSVYVWSETRISL